VKGMQNIMLHGQSLAQNWVYALALIITIFVGGLVSMKLFRWEKEEKIRGSAKLWVLVVLLPFFAIGFWRWLH
ncbi:MAG TPA: hypothetical protein VE133_02430, partial [Candidatus Sulfotelmatobacter sp.]|nr:hypothetical protein [Candidatus Sulfotelmatobacter sp.]